MKKTHLSVLTAILCAYGALLVLLVWAESASPDATITSIKDALWYSVVTVTTVGYGDMSPVTPLGRLIATVFLFLSTSLLAVLVVMAMAFGQVAVRIRLAFMGGRNWYIFSCVNEATCRLAANILSQHPGAAVLFVKDEEKDKQTADTLKKQGAMFVKGTVTDIISLKKSASGIHLFFMDSDSYANYYNSMEYTGRGIKIYCRSDYQPDNTPRDITFFTAPEICARLYWRQRPLPFAAENVVIIGSGSFATALLEQALQVNVFAPQQNITYHLFADTQQFFTLRRRLSQVIAVNTPSTGTDSLFIHTDGWHSHTDILSSADRILLWEDDDSANLENYRRITKHLVTSGDIHLRLSHTLPDAVCFGSANRLYTPALVMHTQLDSTAQAMHNIYLASTGADSPAWSQLSAFTRASNISAADHLQTKIRILLKDENITAVTAANCRAACEKYLQTASEKADFYRATEHLRWMRFHALYNWTYSPQRNNALRRHPCMLPFESLSPADQAKDDYSWQLLADLREIIK